MAEPIAERLRRLLLLVPYVMSRPGVAVEEVCKAFNLTRTQLVADLNLLFVCGLPGYGPGDLIEADIEEGSVIIRAADYLSRPMRLTPEEGLMLYAGAQALMAAGDHDPALVAAMDKLRDALGGDLTGRLSVALEEPPWIEPVRKALDNRKQLHIVYQSASRDEVTERDIDPWALFSSGGHWYLVAYCHKVEDERVFRLDRIRELKMLRRNAKRNDEVDLSKYESVYVQAPDATEVSVEISPEAARWVTEYYPLGGQETLPDGWVRVVLSAGGTAWLERLLLRLGPHARSVQPLWLADNVKAMAERILKRYSDD